MNGAGELPLRDIHLPEPVSAWPPAPGWWLLAVTLLAAAVTAVVLWRRYKRRRAVPKAALRELARIEADFAGHNDKRRLAEALSELLRRAGLSLYPRRETAALTGERWLRWLDAHGGMDAFTREPGRALVRAPYQPDPDYDATGLIALCRQWLENARPPEGSRRA